MNLEMVSEKDNLFCFHYELFPVRSGDVIEIGHVP